MFSRPIWLFALVFFVAGCNSSSAPAISSAADTEDVPPNDSGNEQQPPSPESTPTMPVGSGVELEPTSGVADDLTVFRGLGRFDINSTPSVLVGISSILRNSRYLAELDALYALERAVLDGSLVMQEVALAEGEAFTRALACPEGGRYLFKAGDTGGWNGTYVFDTCVVDGYFRNGQYSVTSGTTVAGDEQNDVVSVSLDALGVSLLGERVGALFGTVSQQQITRQGVVEFTSTTSVRFNDVVLLPGVIEPTVFGLLLVGLPGVIQTATEIVLPSATYTQKTTTEGGLLKRQWRIAQESTLLTTEPDLTVVISQVADELALRGGTDPNAFDTGELALSVGGPDGNRLRVQADNGDAQSFNVIIGAAGESVVSDVLQWNDFNPELFGAPPTLSALSDLASALPD